jgi:hypothetical protein
LPELTQVSSEGRREGSRHISHVARRWRLACTLFLLAVTTACGSGPSLFQQYEYEEEVYLSLDGTATVYVNSSIAALDALRGASFDSRPTARVDREAVRTYFTTPHTHVTRVSESTRSGRRFVHVRLDVDDIRRMADAAPFAWSSYRFARDGNLFVFRQTVGPAAGKDVGAVGWNGSEVAAFRLHLPSKIAYHNTSPQNFRRGNILVWEQRLADRLRGVPLTLDARMETQSILYRTLWLFGLTFITVAIAFGLILWWVMRRPPPAAGTRLPT